MLELLPLQMFRQQFIKIVLVGCLDQDLSAWSDQLRHQNWREEMSCTDGACHLQAIAHYPRQIPKSPVKAWCPCHPSIQSLKVERRCS